MEIKEKLERITRFIILNSQFPPMKIGGWQLENLRKFIIHHSKFAIPLTLLLLSTLALTTATFAASGPDGQVVRVIFKSRAELAQLAARLDIWEVDHEAGALVAYVNASERQWLTANGFAIVPLPAKTAHPKTIPDFPCYRTIAESDAQIDVWAEEHPHLTEVITIGHSYEGRPLRVLRLTNRATDANDQIIPKPVFFLMANIHGRELITNEAALVFVERLLAAYPSDPDVTWLLDEHAIYVLISANPDGHIKNEPGEPWSYWRKNTNPENGYCNGSNYGIDLNRNSSYNWGGVGASSHPCALTYRGPSAASEVETQAIQSFVQSIFEDQRGPEREDAAPDDTTGVFITLHSYGNLVLWPWGDTYNPAPNDAQLRQLGNKFAAFNLYTAQQASDLYPTSGATDDWSYGDLGIASYTFEIGNSNDNFYPGCHRYDALIEPNMSAFLYAAKAARAPYQLPFGPSISGITVPTATIQIGEQVHVRATVDDGDNGGQRIAAAEAYVGAPPWRAGEPITLTAQDGAFDSVVEEITGVIDTTDLEAGRYLLFVRGQDADGAWGPVTATYLDVEPRVTPPTHYLWIPLIVRRNGMPTSQHTNPRQVVGRHAIPTSAGLPIRPTPAKISAQAWAATADAATIDVLVLLAEQADLASARTAPTQAARGRWIQSNLWKVAQHSQRPLQRWLMEQGVAYRSFYIVNMLQLEADRDLALALAGRADVARILTNPQVRMDIGPRLSEAAALVSQPHATQGIEWGVQKINAPEVWAQGFTGQSIVIAGQDTGYDWDHPALRAAYRGWDGAAATHNYHWHDAIHSGGGSCGPDAPAPCDDHGHGTHTMGTMVGDDGGSNQIGVAPGARWIGCRNMDRGWGSPATYAECFEFFVAPYPVGATPALGDPGQAPNVINNSWSCPASEGCDAEHTALLAQVVANVRAAGILVVASAGNGGSGCGTIDAPPSIYTSTYTIGATNSSDNLASFSSRGPVTWNGQVYAKPDIAAPGVSVRSSTRGGGYGLKSGTSMASPHVAGAVALLWSAHPALRADLDWTEQVLNATAEPIPTTACGSEQSAPNHLYGWGRLDVGNAVTSAATIAGVVQQAPATLRTSQALTYEIEAARSPLLTWATTTDAEGRYQMLVVSGTYTLTISHAGEIVAVMPRVQATAGQTTTIDITVPAVCDPVTGTAISWQPPSPMFNSPVTFTGSVSGGSLPITYTWHFEDDDTMVAGNPISHTFTGPPSGTNTLIHSYRATLTVTNACGQDAQTALVPVATACIPVSGTAISWQPPTPTFGMPVTFTGAAATGTLPITYTWQLGEADALIKAGNPITHTFAEPPDSNNTLILPYRVTLTTTNLCSRESIQAWLPLHQTPQPRLYLPVVMRQQTGWDFEAKR